MATIARSGGARHGALGAWLVAAGIVVATGSTTCALPPSPTAYVVSSPPSPTWNGDRVILVTIDGVRWQDVLVGPDPRLGKGNVRLRREELMPTLWSKVASSGVAVGTGTNGCGVMHTASGANVSLPGYQEMFTGHASRCTDNSCPRALATVLDAGPDFGVRGVASISSWGTLSFGASNGRREVFLGAGQRWPVALVGDADDELARAVHAGTDVDPYPGHGDYRPDSETGAIALAYFDRYHPAFFHVGFGDPDEWGHRGDYDAYLRSITYVDVWLAELLTRIDRLDRATANPGRTMILVTTDHGRNADTVDHGPSHGESGQTFLFAFDASVEGSAHGPLPCPTRDVILTDVAPTMAALLGIPVDTTEGAGRPIWNALPEPNRAPRRTLVGRTNVGPGPRRLR